MKLRSLIIALSVLFFSCSKKEEVHQFEINYLDAQKPDTIPIIFGKGTVSMNNRFEMGFTMAPDGKSMAFGVLGDSLPEETCLYLMTYQNGKWSAPDSTFLEDNVNTFYPMFGPASDEFFYVKSRQGASTDLWRAVYKQHKMIHSEPMDSVFNSSSREAGHGKAKNGDFYFTSNRDDQYQCCGDIYFSKLTASGYTEVIRSEELNSLADEESLFLSPDGNYIIVQSWQGEYKSKHDLYISYRTKSNSWTRLKRLNKHINGNQIEQRPFISPDSKFLFFSRTIKTVENELENYDADIYWVSTQQVFQPYIFDDQIEAEVRYNQAFEINLPADLFKDVNNSKLSYWVTLENNSEIPNWIHFDEESFTIRGNWLSQTPISLKLTAIDASGNSADFIFTQVIMH